MSGPERGYLLVADITGYTSYLADTELEHAQSTLTDLLNLLLERTRPPLVVSRTAGDAVISYAFDAAFVTGQTFVEVIEGTYVAFRRAIDLMVLNTTCTCNACRRIDSLDLKFFVHHGEFAIQRLGDHDELVGSDVVVLHRLLKNQVVDETGITAYCLWTDAAIAALGLEDMRASLVDHQESHEHLGEIQTWIQDLGPVWQARQDEPSVDLEGVKVIVSGEIEIARPPEIVWDHLSNLESRLVLMGSEGLDVTDLRDGRVGETSSFVCFHGKGAQTRQTIIEWRPFERVVTLDRPSALGGKVLAYCIYALEPTSTGTRFSETLAGASGPLLKRAMMSGMLRMQRKSWQADIEAFRDRVEGGSVAPA